MIKTLRVAEIETQAGTQVRVGLNEAAVAEYAEAMAGGAKFPAVVVFHDGQRHLAADGFHRLAAARRNGTTLIECDVRQGGKAEALKFALGCNAHHGLRRTNADKRHAVAMAVREFPKASNVAIAGMCLVSDDLVAEIRKAQPSEIGGLRPPPTRVGLDGRERKLPPPPMVRRTEGTNGTLGTAGEGARGTHAGGDACATTDAGGTRGPTLPPPPAQVVDATGWGIPTQLVPFWQRSQEVQDLLTILSRVKGTLRTAQDNRDLLFAEVNFSSALSQLDQAWYDIKTAKPFAVCPTCQGQLPDQCRLCHGRGFVSEHRWNTCVTREDKEFRERAKKG